jgi:hypothetical protein
MSGVPAGTRLARALLAFALGLLALAGSLGDAWGAVYRIDETGTVVTQPVVNMRWRHFVPNRRADNTVEAALRVDLRLNLQPWLNQPARIYMVLAPVNNAAVVARWTTQGRLMPGRVVSGNRALVYEGPAGPASLSESILLMLETDGERMSEIQTLNFHFEIEVGR